VKLRFLPAALAAGLAGCAWPVSAQGQEAPALKSLVFLSSAEKIHKDGLNESAGPVDVDDVPILQDAAFAEKVSALIGKPVSLEGLGTLQPLVSETFAAHHRPAVRMTIPEQTVDSGIVQVLVTEFRIGQVKVEGNEFTPAERLIEQFGVKPEDPVDDQVFSEGLGKLNHSPTRQVNVALRPSEVAGHTDVVLLTTEQSPTSVTAGYNNEGVPSTGRNQWTTGITLGQLLGTLDDTIGYQFLTTDFDGRRPAMLSHTLAISRELEGLGTIAINLLLSNTASPPGSEVLSHGETKNAGIRLTRDLAALGTIRPSVVVGFDYKNSNNNLAFGGTTISSTFSDVDQFVVGLSASRPDDWGRTDVSLTGYLAPGGLTSGNNDASIGASSPGARARYMYAKVDASRTTHLPFDLDFWAHLNWQQSTANLPGSEQLSLGGVSTVRGYPTALLRGDNGAVFNAELRATGLSLWMVDVAPHVFFDHGVVSAVHDLHQAGVGGSLSSAGIGATFGFEHYASLTLDFGLQMRVNGGERRPGQFGQFSVTLTY